MPLKAVTTANGKGTASNGVTAVTIYTAPASLKDLGGNASPGYGAWVQKVRVYNSDTITHDVQLHNIPNGQSLGNDTIADRLSIPAAASAEMLVGKEWMGPSDILQVKLGEAVSSTQVFCRPQVVEST